jgi:phenylpropionate dioxygenase-like ring-hydroxylating dioxygenase large terminal subunit
MSVYESSFNGLTSAQPSLPRAWYCDPDHHDRELDAIWHTSWLYLCRAEDLPAALAYKTFELAGESVLVVRDGGGDLHAHVNVCRHRGSELCPAGEGRFDRPMLRCRYHQWTYRLSGELMATGGARPVPGFERTAHGLLKVALADHGGFVFANLAGEAAPDFEQTAVPGFAEIASWPLRDLVRVHTWSKPLACNWKLFWENFNECLHCPNVHPSLSELVPIYGRAIMDERDDPDWQSNRARSAAAADPKRTGGLREGAESWSADGRRIGPVIEGLTDRDIARGQSYAVVLPSLFVAAHADYVRAVRLLPTGPESMVLTAEWFFPQSTVDSADFDPTPATEFAKTVMLEDGEMCEVSQRGLRNRRFARGILMQEEYEVHAFQSWVRDRLAATPPTAGRTGPRRI